MIAMNVRVGRGGGSAVGGRRSIEVDPREGHAKVGGRSIIGVSTAAHKY